MHCGNSTFVYHNDFNKCLIVERATSEEFFDYFFDFEAEKFLSEKGKKSIFMNYLKNGIQSIFNLIKILMIIWIMMD